MFKHRDKVIGSVIALIVISILIFVGPAEAVLVSLTQPNDVNKGSDTSFSISVEINDPDILPLQYTDLIITGPNGFLKTCRINNDGTDDCSDVDVTISKSSINLVSGSQYGYDQNLGYGYGLGTGYGYRSTTTGTITYNVIYHTPSTLTDGTYSAKVDVYAQGSVSSHTFNSPLKSFTISTASQGENTGGGGGGGHNFVNNENTTTPAVNVIPAENPIIPNPTSEASTNQAEEVAPTASSSPTGFAIAGDLVKKNPAISAILALIILGLMIYGYRWIRKKNN